MSIRLPETDLANWAFQPAWQKRRALEAHERPKSIVGSYEPFRRVFPDAINQQFPLFGDSLEGSGWNEVEQRLVRECKGNGGLIKMNREILHATHAYAMRKEIAAIGIDVLPLRLVSGIGYAFGLNLIMRYADRASIVFLDMRKSNGLTPSGRRFVFSAMHQRFREAYPDFASVELEIWRFKNNKSRDLVCIRQEGELVSWTDLAADVAETHSIWNDVRKGDLDERRGTGTFGPLFDFR